MDNVAARFGGFILGLVVIKTGFAGYDLLNDDIQAGDREWVQVATSTVEGQGVGYIDVDSVAWSDGAVIASFVMLWEGSDVGVGQSQAQRYEVNCDIYERRIVSGTHYNELQGGGWNRTQIQPKDWAVMDKASMVGMVATLLCET